MSQDIPAEIVRKLSWLLLAAVLAVAGVSCLWLLEIHQRDLRISDLERTVDQQAVVIARQSDTIKEQQAAVKNSNKLLLAGSEALNKANSALASQNVETNKSIAVLRQADFVLKQCRERIQ